MGETITLIRSDDTALTITVANTIKYLGGEGLDTLQAEPVWESAYETHTLYGYSHPRREVNLRFQVYADTYDNVRGTMAAVRNHVAYDHAQNALTTLRVVLDNGGTYEMDGAVRAITSPGPQYHMAEMELAFEGNTNTWTYGGSQGSVSAFAGTTPVNVTYNNAGADVAYPVHKITGAWGTAKLTNPATGNYIEIGTAAPNADDQVWIWTDRPMIRYYVNGTDAGSKTAGSAWTGYGGTVSKYEALSIGAGTVQLSAASGTPTYELAYYVQVDGIG